MERDFFPFVEEDTIPDRSAGQIPAGPAAPATEPNRDEATVPTGADVPAPAGPREAGGAATGSCIDACYPARIAVYDDPAVTPRVVVIEPTNVRDFLAEITETVTRLSHEQGGKIPFTIIREIVENYIHASFIEPTITILDGGDTIRFCDQGPGIRDKVRALEFGTTSATEDMKRYIRGVGSGLPIAQQYMVDKGGSLTIEDNISGGTIVTISTHGAAEADAIVAADSAAERSVGQGGAAHGGGGQATDAWGAAAAMGTVPQPQAWQGQPWPGAVGAPVGAAQTPWGYVPQAGYPAGPYHIAPQQPVPGAGPGDGMPWGPGVAPGAAPGAGVPSPSPQFVAGAPAPDAGPGAAGTSAIESIQLSDRGRQILAYLTSHESVGGTDLVAAFGGSAPTWSRELKALDEAGLTHKDGQKRRLTALGGAWLSALGVH